MTEVLRAITAARLLPVVVIDDARTAQPLAAALKRGGLPCAEITLRTPAAEDAIRALADDPGMLVGVVERRVVPSGGRLPLGVEGDLQAAVGFRRGVLAARDMPEVGGGPEGHGQDR